jgi:hypothetical protein
MKLIPKRFLPALLLILLAGSWSSAAEYYYGPARLMQDTLGRRTAQSLNGIWNMQIGGSGDWQGFQVPAALRLRDQFTLVKKFSLDSSMISPSYELEFEGIDGSSIIYLNKRIIATHSAGTAPLATRLTDKELFNNAENELTVQLDSRLDYRKSVPLLVRGRGIPLSGNGLYRPVVLHAGLPPFVSAIALNPGDPGITGTLDLSVSATITLGRMDSLTLASIQQLRAQVEIIDSTSAAPLYASSLLPFFLPAGDTTSVQVEAMIPQFRYWQPGAPQRYRIVVTLFLGREIIDRAAVHFALSQPDQWLAESSKRNGSFRFKMVDWILDESLLLLPQNQQHAVILKDLQGILDLGANSVRIPGGMASDFFLRSCDSLGLAVLLEIPMINIPSAHLDNAAIKLKAKKALSDLILAFRGHPCIAAWGLGSGYDPRDPGVQAFIREYAGIARGFDDRPVFAGIRGKHMATNALPVDLQIVEVPPEKIAQFSSRTWRTKGPFLLQLTSPLVLRHSSDRAAQQNQAYSLKMAILDAERAGEHAGLLISPWKDWSGESPHTYWGPRPNSQLFLAGLLDAEGQQRLAWQVARASFMHSEMPELLPAESPAEDPAIFQILSIGLIVILLFYIRRDKRMSHYLHRVFVYPHGFYMDLIENRQVNPFLTGVIGVASFLTMSTLLASLVFFFRENSMVDEVLTWFFPNSTAKNQAINLIWHPETMIGLFTGLMIGLALVQSLVYKMVVFGQRRYLRFSQIVTFTFWVPANFIFALPLAVVLFRVLAQSNLVMASLIYFALILIWFFLRAWRGSKVALQITLFQALLVLIASSAIIAVVIGLYLEQSRAMVAYANYYWSLFGR